MLEKGLRRQEWYGVGQSVQGASHVRSDTPNQDAMRWSPESRQGPPLMLAVSDGHGSTKCFRSQLGSTYAVDAAVSVIQALVDGQPDLDNLSAVKRMVEEQLPQHLVRRWQQAVQAHLQTHPFREEEWSKLVAKEGPKARQLVESHAFLAYGATVLAVLVTESFVLYLQLGDGDI